MKKALFAILAVFLAAAAAEAGLGNLTKPGKHKPMPQKQVPVKVPEAEVWYPFGLSFAPTVAAFPSKEDGICGLRLGIISANEEMHGLSLNLLGDYDGYSSYALRVSPVWNSAFISRKSVDVAGILNMTGRAFLHEGSGYCSGMQLAFLMNFAFGDYNGVQIGAANFARDFNGLQFGLINRNYSSAGLMLGACNYSQDFSGIQIGIVNLCGKDKNGSGAGIASGLQFGGLNIAEELHGLQLGAVNYAKGGRGLQIGFLNFFGHDDSLVILPLANAKF